MNDSRRMLLESLPLALAALAVDRAWGQQAAGAAAKAADRPIASLAIPFADLPVDRAADHVTRPIVEGQTHSGAHLEVHETTLPSGGAPHPPHHHVSEEMFLISKGAVEVTISGKSTRLGPGSAAFVHSGEEHGIRNPGPETAQYFVVAIGSNA